MIIVLSIFSFFCVISLLQDFKVTTFYVVFVSLITMTIGNYLLSHDYIWYYNLISGILLFISYNIFRKYYLKKSNKKLARNKKLQETPEINIGFIYIILFFIMYHFAVAGIPILDENVEISRFDFSSSGLMGIPGRMVQYGIYFLVFYTGYYYFFEGRYKKYFVISMIFFCLCKLLSGFKGGMYDILVMIVLLIALSKKTYKIKLFFSAKFVMIIIISIFFAVFILSRYNFTNQKNLLEYFMDRLTVIQAEAGNFMLNNMEKDNYFYNDFVFYVRKYLKIDLNPEIGHFALEKIVSANKNNIKLSNSNFIVSVTIGAFNELLFNLNPILAFAGFVILGAGYGYIEKIMKKGNVSPYQYASLGLIIYMITLYISKGGLMYYVMNYILLSAVFLVFFYIGKVLINFKKKLYIKGENNDQD